jgi:hypothetical protein
MVEFKSAMQKMQFDGLEEMIGEHNALVTQVNAATGDRDALYESIVNKPEFEDLRNQIAVLQERLDGHVNEQVEKALSADSGDTAEATEKAKELKSTIASGLSYYKKLYGEDAAEAFTKVERLKGVRVGGGGGGGRRVRGFNVVVTIGDDVEEFENFAGAAKALGIDTSELQDHFFAKGGAEKLKDLPDEVEFVLNWTDVDDEGNETPASAEIRAYRTGPSGPPAKESAEVPPAEADEDDAPESVDLTDVNLEEI